MAMRSIIVVAEMQYVYFISDHPAVGLHGPVSILIIIDNEVERFVVLKN